ncbi:tetrahydromethanopterin S-methyltransferase subunit A [Methanocrinis sp.]|uniref:tetrahydromethanopterin S-methyltransferase subunit A n=1 Tax=Methanocrinis sp. TaxID=3101522 RepID=UPI003D0BC6F8
MTGEHSVISDEDRAGGAGGPSRDLWSWPPIRGDYRLGDPGSRIAVVTLASLLEASGAAIWGPCKTENLGVEKVVANLISNSNLRFLLVCGAESKGHLPGDSILALHRDGIDGEGRIVGSKGAIPFIENLSKEAIDRFQRQVEVIDRIGLVDEAEIEEIVREYRDLSEPFPEPPMLVVKRRARWEGVGDGPSSGDAIFGEGVVLDASVWLVAEEVKS